MVDLLKKWLIYRQSVWREKFLLLSAISFTKTSFTSKQVFRFLLLYSPVRLPGLALTREGFLIGLLLQLIQLLGLLGVSQARLRPRLGRLAAVGILASLQPLSWPHLARTAGPVKVSIGVVNLQAMNPQHLELFLQPGHTSRPLLGHRLPVQHGLPGVVEELVSLHDGFLVPDLVSEVLDLSIILILLGLLRVVVTCPLPGLLLPLQRLQLLHDVGVNKVRNVVALPGLGDHVVLLVVREIVVLLQIHNVIVSQLHLQLPLGLPPGDGGLHVLLVLLQLPLLLLQLLLKSGSRDEGRSDLVVAGLRGGDGEPVHDGLNLLGFVLQLHSVLQQHLAGLRLDVHHAGLSDGAHVHYLHLALLLNGGQHSLLLGAQLGPLQDIRLVGHNQERLVGKQRLDGVEEILLALQGVAALLAGVQEVEDGRSQMGEGSYGLHLNSVPVLQRVVQDTGGVNHLPPQIFVVRVSDVQTLGGEGVGLHLHISSRDLVDEAGLADVRESCDDQSPGVGVDGREPTEVLPDLLQVLEALVLSPHDGRHPSQGGSLQLLTPVQRVTKLQESDVVLGHVVNEVPGSVDLTQSQLVMVFVIQNIHQIGIERMDVFQLRKVLQDLSQLLREI